MSENTDPGGIGMVQETGPRLEVSPDGVAWWSWQGRRFPLIAGGDDGDGEGGENGEGGKGGTAVADPPASKGAGDGDHGSGGDDGDQGGGEPEADHKLRTENKALRQRAKAAEAKLAQLEDAGKSDTERLEGRATKAEAERDAAVSELRGLRLEVAVGKAAKAAGVIDPTAALRLMDADAVEYDDDGRPTEASVARALRAAVKAHPILTRAGGADGGEGGRHDTSPGGFSAMIRAAAQKGG